MVKVYYSRWKQTLPHPTCTILFQNDSPVVLGYSDHCSVPSELKTTSRWIRKQTDYRPSHKLTSLLHIIANLTVSAYPANLSAYPCKKWGDSRDGCTGPDSAPCGWEAWEAGLEIGPTLQVTLQGSSGHTPEYLWPLRGQVVGQLGSGGPSG